MQPENTGNNQDVNPQGSLGQDNSGSSNTSQPSQPQTNQPAQPVSQPQPQTQVSQQTLSQDQVASLKEDISKDLSGRVSQEVSKSVIQKIGEALGLTKKEEEALPTDPKRLTKLINQAIEKKFSEVSQTTEEQQREELSARQERIDNTV